jgi:hypothetical protein
MGAFNVMIICERRPSGHMAIVHAEEIYSDDPFARCSELIEQYGVKVCVCEKLPNFNDAHRFAKRHEGIVFLAGYTSSTDGDPIRWGDSTLSKLDRKTSEEERNRYVVTLDQYRVMQMALARISNHQCVFPDPKGRVQMLSNDGDNGIRGAKQLAPILERVFKHFTRTALIVEKDDEQRKLRAKVVKVGIDPHFSYAFMLMNVAWARAHGSGATFLFPDTEDGSRPAEPAAPAATITDDKCGNCDHWRHVLGSDGQCVKQNMIVADTAAACIFFDRI